MIPVGDVIPRRTTPVVTILVVVVTACAFAGVWLLPGERFWEIIAGYGLVPVAFSGSALLTSLLLHYGPLQAVSNLLALWVFGASVEDRMGPGRFLLFYLVGGLVAGVADVLARNESAWPVVGATGAVAAVISAHFVLFPRSRGLVLVPIPWALDVVEVPSLLLVAFWLLFQVAGGASVFAALGGTTAGLLLVWGFRQRRRETVQWWDL
jgi:membrane associated rhomboid family serine protease